MNPRAATGRLALQLLPWFRAFNSFRCWFECPGDDKRNGKSQRDCCDENLHHPRRRFEGWEQDRRCLNQEPGDNRVRDRNLVNIAPLQFGEEIVVSHFVFSSQSFWKRGSFRSGSNMGSSRSSAGVSGHCPPPNGPSYGSESIFCKAAMARSGSLMRAATRARISIGAGPSKASFSTGIRAMACSDKARAAFLSPTPILVSARS